MRSYHDPDEWKMEVAHRPCTSCNGDLSRCNGGCNGMSSYASVRRSKEEIYAIKEARRRREEDEILAKADAVRAARGAK